MAIVLGEEITDAKWDGSYQETIFSLSWDKQITITNPYHDSQEVVLKDDDGAKYVLPAGEFVWLNVGDTSVRLKHHANEDVEAVFYPRGCETDPSLAESYVFGQDAKAAIREAEAAESEEAAHV